MKKIILILVVSIMALSSCSEEGESYKFTVVLQHSGVADGIYGSAKLVNEGEQYNAEAQYSGAAVFSGGQATVTLNNVDEGTYTGYAMIDINDSGITGPDTGDYVTGSPEDSTFEIDGDFTLTIAESDWDVF